MRKLILPDVSFHIRTKDSVQAITAAEQLHIIVATPPPGQTFTIDQIRARLPLVEKLAALGGEREVLLEDAEYGELEVAAMQAAWTSVSGAAVALIDAVENAEKVEVTEESSETLQGPSEEKDAGDRK